MAWDKLLTWSHTAVTANTNGSSVYVGSTGIAYIQFDVSNVSGTSPSLTIKLQESADGTTWNDVLSLPAMTAAGSARAYFQTSKQYVRYTFTVSGTSPSFDIAVHMR